MRAEALSLLLLLVATAATNFATDIIDPTASITGNQTLVSANRVFRLGFFSPDGGRSYLGIWYDGIPCQTVVWVANRQNPIVTPPGVLKLSADGRLLLLDGHNSTVWSSSAATTRTAAATAHLLDSGNLVVVSSASPRVVWQSFDYPTDTLLSGMKLGVDHRKGIATNMTSWSSATDPSPGAYTFKLVMAAGLPEFFLFRGADRVYASGPWNGAALTGVRDLRSPDFTFATVSSREETYYSYRIAAPSLLSRFVVNGTTGQLQRFVWNGGEWAVFSFYPTDSCDGYAKCGPFGYCVADQSPPCSCLPGFQPRSPEQWGLRDGSGGCVRRTGLRCGAAGGEGFEPVDRMKLPDTTNATVVDAGMTLDRCRQVCLSNCSCTAYAAANVSGGDGRGCVIWTGELLDMRQVTAVVQEVYIRLAQSEIDALNNAAANRRRQNKGRRRLLIAVLATVSGVLLLGAVGCCWFWRNKEGSSERLTQMAPSSHDDELPFRLRKRPVRDERLDENMRSGEEDLDLPLFDLEVIMLATNNFAAENKIGEGGFGPVYLGRLEDGREIAVKRLSRRSTQGVGEFKNEVKLIAKLQHRNLVRLLGCCIDSDERMLVYEFMHNNSLDTFIFDEGKSKLLSWNKRFDIILGIARGLLYLHEDSRFRIIHRDLKASNVLLDRNMSPKISDFGIARMFDSDETTAYTGKVIGTYGYMSPEYAMDGAFSMKSDIYSFGVLVLEIVTGKRIRGFYEPELDLNLLGYAWILWKEGRTTDLLVEPIGSRCDYGEVLRCVQVALLCVDVQPRNRPLMSTVVMMLATDNAMLEPNEPGMNIGRYTSDTGSSQTRTTSELTLTITEAR